MRSACRSPAEVCLLSRHPRSMVSQKGWCIGPNVITFSTQRDLLDLTNEPKIIWEPLQLFTIISLIYIISLNYFWHQRTQISHVDPLRCTSMPGRLKYQNLIEVKIEFGRHCRNWLIHTCEINHVRSSEPECDRQPRGLRHDPIGTDPFVFWICISTIFMMLYFIQFSEYCIPYDPIYKIDAMTSTAWCIIGWVVRREVPSITLLDRGHLITLFRILRTDITDRSIRSATTPRDRGESRSSGACLSPWTGSCVWRLFSHLSYHIC